MATAVVSVASAQLPRAASFPSFLEFKDSLFEDGAFLKFDPEDFRDDVSEADTVASDVPSIASSPELRCMDWKDDSDATSDEAEPELSRPTTASSSLTFGRFRKRRSASPDPKPVDKSEKAHSRTSSISRTLSTRLKRQSWIPGSRSPSPCRKEEQTARRDESPSGSPTKTPRLSRRTSMLRNKMESMVEEKTEEKTEERKSRSRDTSLSRTSSMLGRRLSRPLSAVIPASKIPEKPETPVPAPAPRPSIASAFRMPKSFSSDKLVSASRTKTVQPAEDVRLMTRMDAVEKARVPEAPKPKKDELWSTFRTLENDLEKFLARPSNTKANVIRGCLLPFLRTYQSHASINDIRPEDLDRRVKILNLWWTALLDILHDDGSQAMSPADRPTVMDAISRLMERDEWRKQAKRPMVSETSSSSSLMSRSESTHSFSSDGSEFVAASVSHNVKTIFERNLLSQMVFVVNKMSQARTPASTVDFCGKTCAYAFFFCPGMADILVRLWSPTIGQLQRVLNGCGFSRGTSLAHISKRVVPAFPVALRTLEFTSLVKFYKALKVSVPPPLGTAQVNWTGEWTKRWSGKESDLFYEFSRQFFSLVATFLPEHPTTEEVLCAPGLIFVQAQLLLNIDATLNRHTTTPANSDFGEGVGDPDAESPAITVPTLANANRSMTDNRVIKLVRELLSGAHAPSAIARHVFAESFSKLLQAAAKSIPVVNHNAAFTLCDFLEEALPLLIRYRQKSIYGEVIDWAFWTDVWKKMTESHNTSVEIKVYALVFALWPSIAIDKERKKAICYDFLLGDSFFHTRFNHSCPMVRAYFMRLICWRVARFDGPENEDDKAILKTLLERLYTIYSHYLYLRREAESSMKALPSTIPCPPIPGRRLIIVATDRVAPRSTNNITKFDGIMAQHSTTLQLMESNRIYPPASSAKSQAPSTKTSEEQKPATVEDDRRNRRFSFIRGMMNTPLPIGEAGNSKSSGSNANTTSKAQPPPLVRGNSNSSTNSNTAPDYHRSFKFSLESDKRPFGATAHAMRLYLPRLPMPAQSFLFATSLAIDVANTSPTGAEFATASNPPTPDGASLPREVMTQEPRGAQREVAKYSGRALAEWALVIGEYQSFFERRKMEGVPSNEEVETPVLGVECIRKPS